MTDEKGKLIEGPLPEISPQIADRLFFKARLCNLLESKNRRGVFMAAVMEK